MMYWLFRRVLFIRRRRKRGPEGTVPPPLLSNLTFPKYVLWTEWIRCLKVILHFINYNSETLFSYLFKFRYLKYWTRYLKDWTPHPPTFSFLPPPIPHISLASYGAGFIHICVLPWNLSTSMVLLI